MIDEILGANFNEADQPTANISQKMGRDEFLKIFLAQMKHQDPLNPMEGTEFTAQLAQFSSLEQLFNVNQHLESIKGVEDEAVQFQALNLMGKEILAGGDELSLSEENSASGAFQLNQEATCSVLVRDETGYPIQRILLGTLGPGQHHFEWDGRNEEGLRQIPGLYRFDVTAVDQAGQILPVDTMIRGRVSRVNLEGETPVIYVGEIPIQMSQIVDIRFPEVSSVDTEGNESSATEESG